MHTYAKALVVLSVASLLAGCQKAAEATPDAAPAAANEAPAAPATPPPASALGTYEMKADTGVVNLEDKGYVLMPAKWASPIVPVCWEGASDGVERGWVKDSIGKTWEAKSKLRFVGWGVCAANAKGIRIAVREDGPHTKGLGKLLDGKLEGMVLNFTFKTWSPSCASSPAKRESCIRSIAVHEFGHAIAFAHEQNRPDTPGECTEPPQGTNGDTILTPWDPQSVMNYCNPVYNNSGQLSPGDVYSVQKVYGV